MKFKLPGGVTRTVTRTVMRTRKHSPTILFAAGVVGFGATVVTACQATTRLEEVLDETNAERKEFQTALERADLPQYGQTEFDADMRTAYLRNIGRVAKLYAVPTVLGIVSVACLTGSHKILTNRNAGLTAAYAALQKGYDEYRRRVREELGEEKDREFRFGKEMKDVITEDKNGPKKQKVKKVGDGGGSIYSKFFDEYNQNWSPHGEYNILFLRGVQNQCNDRLRTRGHLFLNEVYDDLGLDRTPAGSQVGWKWGKDGKDGFVDFGIWDDSSMVRFHDFVVGNEGGIWLDFNVDGPIWKMI